MKSFLYRLWFIASQVMAVLSLATIVDQARSWEKLLTWSLTQAPDWIVSALQAIAATFSYISGPWRELGIYVLSAFGLDFPAWAFSAITLVLLVAAGGLRQLVIRRNQRANADRQIRAAIRNTIETGDLNDVTEPDYVITVKNQAIATLMWHVNLIVLHLTFWLSASALLSDLLLHLLDRADEI